MNYLGINCSVAKNLGRVAIVIINEENEAYHFIYKSPSVFSFKKNSAEILNWHRDNVISLISQFNINGIVVKKTERTSFFSRPKNSDIFKLYLEGVFLSLAGSVGIFNKHFYKNEIQSMISTDITFEKSIDEICKLDKLQNNITEVDKGDIEPVKDTLLSVIALKNCMS